MSFTYKDLWNMRHDEALKRRVIACAALEGQFQPASWWESYGWQVVARTDWADAYTYAVATGVADPGDNPGVINDGMILAAVQAVRGTE